MTIRQRDDPRVRWAGWTFVAVLTIAVPVILYQGRDQWFFLDDWDFLANRRVTSFHDLMAPHVSHWTTLPIVVYRALWWAVGLRHYWPYQLCLVLLHVASAVMLRAVMRRANIDPWIATAAASLFLLFGAGRADIVYSFQIAFTGALAFGLAHMLAADHDGPLDRQDLLGMGFGLLALMCSSVGISMAVAVGVSTLVRRGWKIAVAHTVPLAAVFMGWWLVFARDAFAGPKPAAGETVTWMRHALSNLFAQAGQVPGTGWLLAAALIAGLALRWSRLSTADFRRFDGPTVGLAVGAICFVATAAYGRATQVFGQSSTPAASRYVYILAALVLPSVALAASAVVDRWRVALPAAVAVFLIGVPGNIAKLHASAAANKTLGEPDLVLTMARLPLARQLPRTFQPYPTTTGGFSIGWLLDATENGRVPRPASSSPLTVATAEFMLSVNQTDDAPPGICVPMQLGKRVHLDSGDAITFSGDFLQIERPVRGLPPPQRLLAALYGRTLTFGAPLDVRVAAPNPNDRVELCR